MQKETRAIPATDSMDAGSAPAPDPAQAPRHGEDGEAADSSDPSRSSGGDDSRDSLFGRWVKYATSQFSVADGDGAEHEEFDASALGPAFRDCSDAEIRMVQNILRLRDLRVSDVMTPRADIVAVSEDADLAQVMQAFEHGQLSRVPVFRETLDDPIGFVHLKDLALAYGVGCGTGARSFRMRDHIRTALFVPPSMRIAALMQKMQGSRVHMALVIDEFGGVDGLVTIEDLVEQIVGDIEDEHDQDEMAMWREESPGVWLLNARADISEFEEEAGVNLNADEWAEDVDTLGGLVFGLTGRVPARAEVIAHPDGHEFEILDADARRIKRMRLRLAGSSALAEGQRKAAE